MRRNLKFPDAKKFSDLFEEWRWQVHEKSQGFEPVKLRSWAVISDLCLALNTALEDSLHVRPNSAVIECVSRDMFIADYDSIYFEIIEVKDGLLVSVRNSKIIGSRYLAVLPLSEIDIIREGATTVLKESA